MTTMNNTFGYMSGQCGLSMASLIDEDALSGKKKLPYYFYGVVPTETLYSYLMEKEQ
jgi:hypothetical protein